MDILPAKILTIDDEPLLRRSLVCFLEDSGFDIIEASNGQEGLAAFRQQKPDLVISDLQMPVMSGLELLQEITRESPQTPVIVLSGAGVMDDAIAALRLGAWDYMLKPVQDMAVLEHSIVKGIEKQRLVVENEKIRRTLQEDQEAARSVQEKIHPPKHFDAPIFSLEQSVLPSLYLSGDFVDYFELDNRYFIFYLADVSGHGSSAAFLTVLIRTYIRDLKSKYQHGHKSVALLDPTRLLAELSEEVFEAKLGKYLTLLYFIFDQEELKLTYSVGGHYPNPIIIQDQKAKYLPGHGYPIGILKDATFETEQLQLEKPVQIALFSDGIYEMIPGDFETKEKVHLEKLQKHSQSIDECIEAFGYGHIHDRPDDISLMLFNFKGREARE